VSRVDFRGGHDQRQENGCHDCAQSIEVQRHDNLLVLRNDSGEWL
jgi:hypothetical protein